MAPLTMYSAVVPNSPDVAGEGKPRRSVLCPESLVENYAASYKTGANVTTLYENFLEGIHRSGGQAFLGTRPIINGVPQNYEWQSYVEVQERVKHFGAGLAHLGLAPKSHFGVFSINRAEWTMSELAGYQYNYTSVPLYDTLGVSAIEFIVNQTEMETIIASPDKAQILLNMKSSLPTLKNIVVMGAVDETLLTEGKELKIHVVAWTDVEANGKATPVEAVHPTAEDIATICYTSGTTGTPKGAVLTHRNFVAGIGSLHMMARHGKFFIPSAADTHVSYLPLAHVFERLCQAVMISGAARVGYYQGDTLKLLDDVAILQPTIFASVPRLFNRIYDKVLAGVKAKGGVAAFLFNRAYAAKKANLRKGVMTHAIWDKLVFGAIRARLGGKVKHIVSGSAPISPDVMDFLRICFSADVYEGYGQTEQAAGLCMSYRGDLTTGQVGPPQLCVEVKLKDLPAMNYTSQDKPFPRGEIMLRGASVFNGYYKAPKQTAETLDAEGWASTGDVGQWDAQGRLVVIDRVKNIFKLAQGEYIAPEKIEGVLAKHYLVAQVFVHGDSLQATLVGVVIPDPDTLKLWANENGLRGKSYEELCRDAKVKTTLQKDLAVFGKESDLKGFEILKNIHVDSEQFSIENDLLTPTFKLKRHQAKEKYQAEIDRMYSEIA
ncbi:Long chain acyl-CoA synthetase 7 peroxisomal [Podila clonocystis]|nr:Long chain acyl-CoA synthetase 7 peroxisomal [Podila clonocystis]